MSKFVKNFVVVMKSDAVSSPAGSTVSFGSGGGTTSPGDGADSIVSPSMSVGGGVLTRALEALLAGQLKVARVSSARVSWLFQGGITTGKLEAVLARVRAYTRQAHPEYDRLYTWFEVRVSILEVAEVQRALASSSVVDRWYPFPTVSLATEGDGQQQLDAATVGVGADGVRSSPAWRGSGQRLIDVEEGWVTSSKEFSGVTLNRHGDDSGNDHGTKVLGVILAREDKSTAAELQCIGVAPATSTAELVGFGTTWSLYDALGAVIDLTGAKVPTTDVVVLPIQSTWCARSKKALTGGVSLSGLPVEVDPVVSETLKLIVDTGAIVVEAAGNGAVNLDAYTLLTANSVTATAASSPFSPVGMVVGGAEPATGSNNWKRVTSATYGGAVKVYAAAARVKTVGTGPTFTTSFDGTSAASSIVAGVVITVQGARAAGGRAALTQSEMLTKLKTTSTFVLAGTKKIGVIPDLEAIKASLG